MPARVNLTKLALVIYFALSFQQAHSDSTAFVNQAYNPSSDTYSVSLVIDGATSALGGSNISVGSTYDFGSAPLNTISDFTFDSASGDLYVLSQDSNNASASQVSKITAASNYSTTEPKLSTYPVGFNTDNNLAVYNGYIAFVNQVYNPSDSTYSTSLTIDGATSALGGSNISVGSTYDFGSAPLNTISDFTFDSVSGDLYVLSQDSSNPSASQVSKISAASNYATIESILSTYPIGVDMDNNLAVFNGLIAMVNQVFDPSDSTYSTSLTIDGATSALGGSNISVGSTYDFGSAPLNTISDFTFDSASGDLYVLSQDSNNASASQVSKITAASNYSVVETMFSTYPLGFSTNNNLAVYTGSPVSPVPIPAAAWLFASALGVFGYLGKRKANA